MYQRKFIRPISMAHTRKTLTEMLKENLLAVLVSQAVSGILKEKYFSYKMVWRAYKRDKIIPKSRLSQAEILALANDLA